MSPTSHREVAPGGAAATEGAVATGVTAALVLLVDERDSVRADLTRRLRRQGLEVASFATAGLLLTDLPSERQACVVCDLDLNDMSALELLEELQARSPSLPLVLLSSRDALELGLCAMRAGAADCLVTPVPDARLADAVRSALRSLQPEWRRGVLRREIRRRAERLTPREREVFDLVVAGLLNKQIARELDACEKTIKVHRARVMQKMGAGSLAELVRLAVRGDMRSYEPTTTERTRR